MLNEAAAINVPHQGTVNIVNPDGTFNSDATLAQIDIVPGGAARLSRTRKAT